MVIFHEYGENVNGTECGRINQTAGQFTLIVALIFLLPVFRIFRSFFPFQPGRILLCQRYQPYAVRIRIVEQLVEHIGRKGLAQTRAVEHRSGGMVYEGDTIQTSFGIDTVNHFYIRLFQLSDEILFRTDILHGFDNFLSCPFGKVVLFHLFSRSGKLLLQCFITECLSELAGFERRAYLLSVIIQSPVHDAVIFLPVHTPPTS